MMLKRVMLALIAVCTLASQSANAEYPDKPITLIVPWAVGGSTDQTARVLAKAAEAYLGQPIIVINRPGASTTIGMAELAKANPDGYTIGTLSSTGYLVQLQGRQLSFDPINDFSYISYYGDNLIGIAVLQDSPYKKLSDLLDVGRTSPGKLKYGTAGVGTTQHLTILALQRDSKTKFVHVPQQGSAASAPALLGAHVDFIMETSVWAPFIESKQMRLLAVSSVNRSAVYPDVPTFSELGFKSLRSVQAIIGPKGLPEDIRAKLESAFRKALSDKAFQETMKNLAMQVVDLPGAEVKKLVESEYSLARELIESSQK
ncbi:MAG: tripartite tricarboxylate transporter substrate binding protein [Xanthobacteraceae bacterium]|nr:tripartite tricarboxylate transporter substrate binding protein [Xanthobacteraceae bacterium]QYK45666.1 MAG: tripartite tricarboxylate transporter substrate binding protein [Xanthobacteraceae bacterium]